MHCLSTCCHWQSNLPTCLQEEVLRHVPIIYKQDNGLLPGKFWSAIYEIEGAVLAGQAEFQSEPIESGSTLIVTRDSRGTTSEADKVLLCSPNRLYSNLSMASMPLPAASGHTAKCPQQSLVISVHPDFGLAQLLSI